MNKPVQQPRMPTTGSTHAYRHTRSISRGGSGCAAYLFAILGIFIGVFSIASGGNVIGLVLAVLLIGIAALAEPKKHRTAICGACGNEVAPTSSLCPTCRAKLTAAPRRFRLDPVAWAILVFALALGLFFLWLRYR